MNDVLPAFSGCGIELEYMIVDRHTLAVLPVADELLHRLAGEYACEVRQGALCWSNELVLHLLELKNSNPDTAMESLPDALQGEIRHINRLLEPMGARLMPTAMHPFMNPRAETRLWPHLSAKIYRAYDRIFGCRCHGWANLQSLQLNLPFAGDQEFARLHAAVRLLLPHRLPQRPRAVGDLLRELVAPTELLSHHLDDVVGVAVVLGVDQRLRHFSAAWEDLRADAVAKRSNDGANLVRRHDVPVKGRGHVREVVLQLLPANGAREAVTLINP